MSAEGQNEYGSDHLILMGGWGVGGKMSSGLDLFLPRRDPVFLFASYTKRTIAFTPVLDIFFLAKSDPGYFFSPILLAHPYKIQRVAP